MRFNFTKLNTIPAKVKQINIRKLNGTTVLAILSYLNILVVIPLLVSKNKPFLRFHAIQGTILLAFFAVVVFTMYLPAVPYVFALFYAVCLLSGLINVIRGGEKHLPLIGRLADRI